MISIRRRLLILLLGLWATVCVAVVLVAIERSQHEVEELLDAQLAQTARVLRRIALAGNLSDIEKTLPQTMSPLGHPYETKISFQLWDEDDLVASFGAAPSDRLAKEVGYSDRQIGPTKWRVFGLPYTTDDQYLYVAQDYSIRLELVQFLTVHALQPILWSLPVSILLIWYAVSDGLRPLIRLAGAVSRRSAKRLDPIGDDGMPIVEIQPLIDALNGLLERLRQTFAAERRFAADASHELRTPLAIISTHAQIARRSTDEAERNDAFDNLGRGIERATRLVSQLMIQARLGTAVAEPDGVSGSLARVVELAIEDLRSVAEDKTIALIHVRDGDDPLLVNVPALELEVLVGNLVDNAVKYTPPGGRVEVRAGRHGERVLLTVSDSGPGIAESERERVFDRFYRPAGQQAPGAGLGLSIVQRICELYDAEIELQDAREGVDAGVVQGLQVRLSLHASSTYEGED